MMIFMFQLIALAALVGGAVLPRSSGQVTLPQFDSDPTGRARAIAAKRAGFLYGPPLLNGAFFPTGPLAEARIGNDIAQFEVDSTYVSSNIANDLLLAEQAVGVNGGLKSLADYANVLYTNEWKTSIPDGEDPGILTNYTQDLLFSMERLSLNPYLLRRLDPSDKLPFTIPLLTSIQITGLPIQALQALGRLFIVDHSYQAKLSKSNRFGAACTALFFIHPLSGDFLPLAIRTNTGSNLIYTPLDSPNDWLLAKIMFNSNDLFHGEMFHLIASHEVAEIVHQAAERTLSDNHPVLAVLDRLMTQAYAIRPVGSQVLFNPGGSFDQAFYINSTGALQYVTEFYPTGGAFRSNYLETDLESRGLINPPVTSPKFKSFPFYNDAKTIRDSIKAFITTFVDDYYTSEAVFTADTEIHAWFAEANGPAQVIDFPCSSSNKNGLHNKCSRQTLIGILTHFAYLTGVVHHALNTGDPVASMGTLPFHPAALYAPIPTTKGVTNLLPFLPPVPAALFQIDLLAAFNRPQYASQNKTLAFAFSDPTFLSRFNAKVGGSGG